MRIALCLFTLALCGCKSISSVRAPEALAGNRGYLYGKSTVVPTPAPPAAKDFGSLIQAAQAAASVAEQDSQPDKRREAAKRGIIAARDARAMQPDRVEGHYWYAINVGLLADVDRSYGLAAVAEMEPALKRAGEIDERYDYAGPLRVLGILLLRTPAPPVSIGSPRRGLRLLQRAVELFPDYPENYLYLGEALREAGRADEAKTAWQKALALPAPADRKLEAKRWQQQATHLLAGGRDGAGGSSR
ncbi:MAG: tetratricopeptide repeat protein [Verrucomicrobia bacterium]|nr:tetratricopeptide repeat protein [Verrucomicrobiota bacterium]